MLHLWFFLDIDNVGWFDFIIKCEQLFLRNIYSADELEKLGIETEEKYAEIIYRLLGILSVIRKRNKRW